MDKDLQEFAVIMAVTSPLWAALSFILFDALAHEVKQWVLSRQIVDFGWVIIGTFVTVAAVAFLVISIISIYALIFN